jgi:hypothetical protein
MNVTQYTFKSPSTMQVQVGTPVHSSQQAQTSTASSENLEKATNQSLKDAENFQATQVKEVTPSVDSKYTLDIYA